MINEYEFDWDDNKYHIEYEAYLEDGSFDAYNRTGDAERFEAYNIKLDWFKVFLNGKTIKPSHLMSEYLKKELKAHAFDLIESAKH